MKSVILASIVALIGLALGCTRKAEQLSGFGKIQSPKGRWDIELLDAPPGLRITERENTTSVRSPVAWTSTKDAFVYVDNDERIWAFDGDRQTFIYEKIREGEYGASTLATWQRSVPTRFNEKLPQQMKR